MRTTPVALIEFLGLAPASREAATPKRRTPGALDYQLPGRDWAPLFDGIACFGAVRPILFLHLAAELEAEPEAEPVAWHRIH
ncbi:hypothetical protein [Dyella sp. 2RAB6]|uniref:hypothetical protein n=1 Tax=Dyella sp. 2RAB6 TaxID=3232992 RepID=UPI003F8E2718